MTLIPRARLSPRFLVTAVALLVLTGSALYSQTAPAGGQVSEEYLLRLAESYARFFYQYDAAPVLIVNSEHLNFVDTPADFDLLLQRITAMRGPREFFSLGE